MNKEDYLTFYQLKNNFTRDYWKKIKDESEHGLRDCIKDNLKNEFAFFSHNNIQDSTPSSFELIIAFAKHGDLEDPLCFEKLIDTSQRFSNKPGTNPDETPPLRPIFKPRKRVVYHPHPIIIIGTDDVMQGLNQDELSKAYPNASHLLKDKLPFEAEIPIRKAIRQSLDARYRFFDSSIWHYYVPFLPIDSFYKRLQNVVREIYDQRYLYGTIVAKEYLEFQCRKLVDSYFMDLTTGHSKKVTPFRFHSESAMRLRAEEQLTKTANYTWGCLIIDDYFKKGLRTDQPIDKKENLGKSMAEMQEGCHPESKIPLIKKLLNKRRDSKTHVVKILNENSPDPQTAYINWAIDCIKDNPGTDIIFLDYFYGVKEVELNQQYGHYLLRHILQDKSNEERKNVQHQPEKQETDDRCQSMKSPFDKFWIFPISVFDYAFKSHLRAMGINKVNKHLMISDGADPVNTPELFRYMFYDFLITYMSNIGLNLDELIPQMIRELEKHGSVKKVFRDFYPKISEINTRIQKLKGVSTSSLRNEPKSEDNIKTSHSWFASTYLQRLDQKYLLSNLCLHLQHLAYLIVYGLPSDWPQMWEESQLIKQLVNEFEFEKNDKNKDLIKTQKAGRKLLVAVEEHIIELKYQFL